VSCFFADAWFYIALLDADDQGHARAAAWMEAGGGRIVTTRWVLAEVANSLSAPALRGLTADFLYVLETLPEVKIAQDSDGLYARGLALYSRRADKEWSLTDCISFLVMADEEISDALTNDHHFEQAGFTTIFAD
jgi:uncharacterized protein